MEERNSSIIHSSFSASYSSPHNNFLQLFSLCRVCKISTTTLLGHAVDCSEEKLCVLLRVTHKALRVFLTLFAPLFAKIFMCDMCSFCCVYFTKWIYENNLLFFLRLSTQCRGCCCSCVFGEGKFLQDLLSHHSVLPHGHLSCCHWSATRVWKCPHIIAIARSRKKQLKLEHWMGEDESCKMRREFTEIIIITPATAHERVKSFIFAVNR